MLDSIFAGFLNSVIVCDSLCAQPQNRELDNRMQVETKICESFTKNYQHVKLTSIKVAASQAKVRDKGSDTLQELYQPVIATPLAGRVKISWLVKQKDDQVQQLSVVYAMEAFKDVPIFNRALNTNQEIRESDVSYQSVNVAPYFGLKNFYQGSPTGKMLLKKVTKGGYVFVENISESALVKVNDEITLIVKSGGLSISTLAIALENGYNLDASIKVRVKETGATMSANIQTEKIAYVEI